MDNLEKPSVFLCFRSQVVRGQPRTTGMVSGPEEQVNCPHNSPGYRIESPLARPHSFASPRPLARTNETKRFPGWGHKGLTPQPPISLVLQWLSAKLLTNHCFFKDFSLTPRQLSGHGLDRGVGLLGCPRKVLLFHWF